MTRFHFVAVLLLVGCDRVGPTREAPVEGLSPALSTSGPIVSAPEVALAEASKLATSPEFETLEVPASLSTPSGGTSATPRSRTFAVTSAQPTTGTFAKTCPPIGALRCAHCKPMKCVDGRWVASTEPGKKCESPPPPCAGAPGVCPVYECVDGRWIEGPRRRFEEVPRPKA